MSAKIFTLIHDTGKGLKFYEFTTSEDLNDCYERLCDTYRMFTDAFTYDSDDEVISINFTSDPSQFSERY